MNGLLSFIVLLNWLAIVAVCWFGWQLLRQNGRILLRVDELEERLDEMEFGGGAEPEGLAPGSEAPAFELPDLSGERKSLAQFRGQPVLLIFFNPDCGFCREMVPKLNSLFSEGRAPRVPDTSGAQTDQGLVELGPPKDGTDGKPSLLILTTGDAEKNRQLFSEHNVDLPVLLQQDGEVAKAYQANGTPSGYLIGADGRIASQLAMGAEALLKLANAPRSSRPVLRSSTAEGGREEAQTEESEIDESLVSSAPTSTNGTERANRFSNRALAKSKIKRDGLKAGTPAPDFQLPRLDGKGDLSLSELRGKRVLLVFSSPGCGPCDALAPELEKFHRQQAERDRSPVAAGRHAGVPWEMEGQSGFGAAAVGDRPRSGPITIVMISKGEPKENRAKVKEHGLTFPIVFQQQWEISRRYAMFATPIAYLIDEEGIIVRDVAVGVEPILGLLAGDSESAVRNGNTSFALDLAMHPR